MDSQRFDALARRLGGASSRRRMLSTLVASALSPVLRTVAPDEAAAACKEYNAKCSPDSSCCPSAGLRCVKKGGKRRCRCKKGWKRCSGNDVGCLNVQADPDNCSECGNECPADKPCCFGGKCQKRCNGTCCTDCFVEILLNGMPSDQPVCCLATGGTICGPNEKKTSDDRCCYPDQECIDGKCCCDGCEGSVVCGGECCAIEACCNGNCCPQGKVCATTPDGDECVSANRNCGGGCLAGEVCRDGTCCSGLRVCGDVCCDADEYCSLQGFPIQKCCPINTICSGSFRGHRVRR